MSAVSEFRHSLSELNTESTITTSASFVDDVADILDGPSVGASLPFDDVSLSELDVNLDPTVEEVRTANTGVVGSRLGVSSLGTVAIHARNTGDELVSLYPENHVVVLREADLREDLESAFEWIRSEFEAGRRSLVLATGPSSTADMGAPVQGVHGPAEVHVVVLQNDE